MFRRLIPVVSSDGRRTRGLLILLAVAGLVLASCSEREPAPTTDAPVAGTMQDDVATDDHEHDDASAAFPWDGPTAPAIEVSVTGDPESGWDISATITGLTFSDPATTDHVPGQGHTHVFVDGQLLTMSYEPVVHVDHLEPGPHQAMVTLSRNDHSDYSLDGELIMGMASFTVPGDADPADVTLTAMYMNGAVSGIEGRPAIARGDIVEITVQSDVADEVHVHGYEILRGLAAGQPETIRFTADIPGIFEIELEGSGVLLLEIQVR